MANRLKGEVALEVEGATWTLVFDVNAMCEVEYLLDQSTAEILTRLAANPPLHVVRALLWGALRRRHPNTDLNKAGEIIEAIGGPGVALEKIGEALIAAFPEAKETPADPRKGAAAGRGRRS